MKNYIAGTIVVTGLIILIFGADANAQSVKTLVATIPFDFFVGNEKHSEGRYEFEPANRNAHPGALIIRPLSGSARRSAIVAVLSGEISKTSEDFAIVFNRYGATHYLSRVEFETGNAALRLAKTSGEREIGKQYQRAVPIVIGPATGNGN